jgi:hypothetical protein
VPALNIRCTWEKQVSRSNKTSANDILLAEAPHVVEQDDEPVNRAIDALFDRLSNDWPKQKRR